MECSGCGPHCWPPKKERPLPSTVPAYCCCLALPASPSFYLLTRRLSQNKATQIITTQPKTRLQYEKAHRGPSSLSLACVCFADTINLVGLSISRLLWGHEWGLDTTSAQPAGEHSCATLPQCPLGLRSAHHNR